MADNTPLSLRGKVIYQIFTRNYKEGTFHAVQEDLPRLKALGVDIIYLLPVQPSGKVNRKGSMGSPYAIRDYRAVDPVQGTPEDFRALCSAVHECGMQIIIDVVYNHTSPDSVLAETHPEWFYHKADGSFGNHIGDWWDVIDLDYTQPALWGYQIDTLKMWAEYVDGFRCDVAPMIPLDFWLRARHEVAEIRPGCIWLAESGEPAFINTLRKLGMTASSDSELYRAFDLNYDYDTYEDMKAVLQGEIPLPAYLESVNRQEWMYPVNYGKMRFLENHDRPRAAALIPDEKALKSWTAWAYFCKGPMMLYAGEEFCVTHHPTLFDRDTVDFNTGKDISSFLARLSALKKQPIFSEGLFRARPSGRHGQVVSAVWEEPVTGSVPKLRALGFFPMNGETAAVRPDVPDGTYHDEISGKEIDIFENVLTLRGEPVVILTERQIEAHR